MTAPPRISPDIGAFRSLVNELTGFLDCYRTDMRYAAGNTNVQVLQDKLDAARLALAASVAQTSGPTAEQLAALVRYLESQSYRLTKALENPSWTPRRSHVEGDRNAFVTAANTLDQALRASPDSSTDPAPIDFADAYTSARKQISDQVAAEVAIRNSFDEKLHRPDLETDAEFVHRIIATYLALASTDQREGGK